MSILRHRSAAFLIISFALATQSVRADSSPEQIEFFERKIRPVLVEHCYQCHSEKAKEIQGGLVLDSLAGMRTGGDNGPALVPGAPDSSLLVRAIRHEGPEMPPDRRLPANIVADFETWIRSGAADPRTSATAPRNERQIDIAAGREFWAFQPPVAHPAPRVRNADWPRGKVDAFLLSRLEQAGLEPNQPADRRTWLRRVSFDLTGVPPTPDELEGFLNDNSLDAERRVVDRLLATPRFGERWARMWLDVARFAEDQAHIVGNDQSLTYPNAYLYRDWVIGAFNDDVAYDDLIRQQLASDLLAPDAPARHVALGFLGLGPKYYRRNALEVMADEWEDRVDVVCRGLLGLTVACARCHDHKFDPIGTEDYYALAGVFASTRMFNRPLREGVEKKGDDAKDPKDALHIVREGTPTDLNVFIRGNVENKGPSAPRGLVRVLHGGEPRRFTLGSGRAELAEAIASHDNPLTARVFVNRVWLQCFGRPLVGTPSNFGVMGERPTHPELLDDLSVRFMDAGWSIKWLVREIMLSAAYAQSSDVEATKQSADPENKLYGRMLRRRLSAEAWRDAVLTVTDRRDNAVGGKSVDPQDPAVRKRTVYSAVSRLELNRLLTLFDYPDPNIHSDRRIETTTPLQKLFLLNSPFMNQQAEFLVDRLFREAPGDGNDERRIQRAYELLFARPATSQELNLARQYLTSGDPRTAWRGYAHSLLATNEMLYLD